MSQMLRYCVLLFILVGSSYCLAEPGVAAEVKLLVRTPTNTSPILYDPHTRAWLDSVPTIKVAIWGRPRPPLYMGYESGSFEGLTSDVLGALQGMLRARFSIFRYASREDALRAVTRGDIDMLAFNNESLDHNPLVKGTIPYLLNLRILIKRSEDQAKKSSDFAERRIGYVSVDEGSAARLRIRYPKATLISFTDYLTALTALAYKQIDGVHTGSITAEYLSSRFFRDEVYVEEEADSFSKANINFAVSAWRPELLSALNHSIAALPLLEMQRITSSWGLSDDCVLARPSLFLTSDQKAWIASHPNPKMIVAAANVPLSFYDEKGEMRGLSIDLIKIIERYTGLKFQIIRSDAVSEMVRMLQNSQADAIATLVIGDNRVATDQFTRPYLTSPFVVVTRRATKNILSLDELSGKRLALTQGNPVSKWVEEKYPGIKIVTVENATRGLEMLAEGSVEGAVHTWFGADYFITQHFRSELQIISGFGPTYAQVAMAVSPDSLILKDILNAALLKISPSTLTDLTDQWRSNTPSAAASSWSTYHDLIYQIIGAAVFIGITFLIWIYYLRRQIWQRQKAEQDLENQLEFSRTLIDGAPLALYVRDRDGKLVHCNQAYLDFVQRTREELLGKTLVESGHAAPVSIARQHEIYLNVLEKGEPFFGDVDVVMHSKDYRLYHWILPYRGTKGAIRGLIGGWLDISEREYLIAELERAKEDAVQASHSKSAFLASMSHEIRTPISALIGLIELLRKQDLSHDQRNERLEVAHQSAQSLLSLVGDILDLSKIEAGAMVAAPRPTHLTQLIESIHHLFEPNATKKKLDYRLIVDVEHPEIFIDPLMLNQIVSNLLSNAIKFTEQGAVYVRVREIKEESNNVSCSYEIQIVDTGTGLTDTEQKEIFEPFVQVNNSVFQRLGTGLGLSICKRLVQVLGIKLTLESQKGVGSRFTLRFNAEPTGPISVNAEVAKNLNHSTKRLRILVAEDHAPNRLLLCQQIEYLGHEAVPCNDGDSAFRLWGENKPPFDLAITDCNMPNVDGYELTRKIREYEHENCLSPLPIFGLTANAQSEIVSKCVAVGMNRCLFKPLSVDSLSTLLEDIAEDALRRSRANRAESELEKIRALKPDAYQSLLDQLLKSNREDSEKLLDAMSRGDYRAVGRLAHKIKGGAQLTSDVGLIDACKVLEEVSVTEARPKIAQKVNAVQMGINALEARLLDGQ